MNRRTKEAKKCEKEIKERMRLRLDKRSAPTLYYFYSIDWFLIFFLMIIKPPYAPNVKFLFVMIFDHFFFICLLFCFLGKKSKAKWILWLFRSSTTVRNRHGTVDRIYRTQCFLTESRPQFETHGFFSLILKYKQIESIGYTSQTMEKLTRIDKETHFDPIHVAETNRTVRSQENTCWAYRFLGK